MSTFEVHIPAADATGFNITLKVKADNWMAALKAGMQKLGEQGATGQNVMVDIQDDNSIHVTESESGRVFRIRELTVEEAAAAPIKRPSGIFRPPPAEPKTEPGLRAVPAPDAAKTLPPTPVAELQPPTPDTAKTLVGLPAPAKPAPAPAPPPARTVRERPGPAAPPPAAHHKSSPRIDVGEVEELEHPVKPVVGAIGRPRTNPAAQAVIKQSVEDLLSDVFLKVTELGALKSPEAALQFLLDLAMEKVPCEAGSVLHADGATGDLSFAVARGPKAKELLDAKLVIPAGTGIASFCAAEGVSVAVSDAKKDPRFYAGVGQKVDYETRSLLCAPMMTHGRSFGAMQLINRSNNQPFLEHEVGVLAYLAHQAALYLNDRS